MISSTTRSRPRAIAGLLVLAIAVALTTGCNLFRGGSSGGGGGGQPTQQFGNVVFVNSTAARLNIFVNGIFIDFLDAGASRSVRTPAGLTEVKAEVQSNTPTRNPRTFGPRRVTVPVGGSVTWRVQ